MLKAHHYTFSLLQRALDGLALLLAWNLAYFIRFDIFPGGEKGLQWTFIKLSFLLIFVSIYIFNRNGLYKSYRFNSRFKEISAVFQANTLSFLVLVIALYFFMENKVSRVMLAHYFLLSHFFLISIRITTRNLLRHLRSKGKNLRHILLIGNGEQMGQYVESVRSFKDLGLSFIGWLEAEGLAAKYGIRAIDEDLEKARDKYRPDCIVIGFSGEKSSRTNDILRACYNDVADLQVLPDLSYAFIGHEISDWNGRPIITFNRPNISSMDAFIKRCFDLFFSGLGVLILSPLLLLISILIKATSRGPIFYGQERMGLDGSCFTMWKFRSMRIDAEVKTGAVWCVENDPRCTPIGRFLRASSLDELPQLWNVFIGDMSLVGPRPERPVFVQQFRHQIPFYMLRHKVKAGITGWAQINGWRGNTSLERRIEFDIYYIKNWSLFLDFKIIFMTFWKGFFNKNAY